MLKIALVLALVACAGHPQATGDRTGKGAPTAERIEKRTLVVAGRTSGALTIASRADGTFGVTYDELQNGRGSKISATLTVAPDGTLATYTASGKHLMGTPLSASFERVGKQARWTSPEETGTVEVAGPAMFVPIGDLPVEWLLVPAALKAGGTLPLLPAGEAKVAKVDEVDVAVGTQTKHLVAYAIDGLGLETSYTWFERDGAWFGTTNTWRTVVPTGWESVADTLVRRQDELDHARAARLASTHARRPKVGIALTNVRVLDVEKSTWTPGQTVVVVGDKITAIGPVGKIRIPDGVETLAADGLGVMPGLVEMHAHLSQTDGLLDIAAGVTTVRDVGNDPDVLDDLKARFDAGTMIGPHVVRLGFIEGRNPKAAASKVTAETPDEAKAAVATYAKRGYEGIKIYNSVRRELVPLLAAEAHARGMFVTGHVPVHMRASEVIAAGYDGLEHVNMLFLNFFVTKDTDTRDTTRFTLVGDKAADFALDGAPARELFAQLRTRNTVVVPTLAVFEGLFTSVPGHVAPGLEETVARLPLAAMRWFRMGGLPMPSDKQALYARSWTKMLAMVKALWEQKVFLVLGTDSINGVMLHHEMALYVAAGIPAKDVVRMATLDAARALRAEKTTGTVTVGKRADLVLVDGDPIADIASMRRTVYTLRAGVVFETAAIYAAAGVKP